MSRLQTLGWGPVFSSQLSLEEAQNLLPARAVEERGPRRIRPGERAMNRWTVWLGAARRRVEGAGELVATAKLKAILQKEARGDTNVVVRPATVENLAAVRGYGVLIFKGHGLEGANIAP